MNIYEIYALAGENATDVVNRFGSEVVVEKFALRFLDDTELRKPRLGIVLGRYASRFPRRSYA